MQILQSATVAKVAAAAALAALAYYTFEPPLENVTLNLLKVGDSAAVARQRRQLVRTAYILLLLRDLLQNKVITAHFSARVATGQRYQLRFQTTTTFV